MKCRVAVCTNRAQRGEDYCVDCEQAIRVALAAARAEREASGPAENGAPETDGEAERRRTHRARDARERAM